MEARTFDQKVVHPGRVGLGFCYICPKVLWLQSSLQNPLPFLVPRELYNVVGRGQIYRRIFILVLGLRAAGKGFQEVCDLFN